jgi:hypothetical protein
MIISVVFSHILNVKLFNAAEEDKLQLFQCQALLYGFHHGNNLFNYLKHLVFYLVF